MGRVDALSLLYLLPVELTLQLSFGSLHLLCGPLDLTVEVRQRFLLDDLG